MDRCPRCSETLTPFIIDRAEFTGCQAQHGYWIPLWCFELIKKNFPIDGLRQLSKKKKNPSTNRCWTCLKELNTLAIKAGSFPRSLDLCESCDAAFVSPAVCQKILGTPLVLTASTKPVESFQFEKVNVADGIASSFGLFRIRNVPTPQNH
jgi:hypothetical protein